VRFSGKSLQDGWVKDHEKIEDGEKVGRWKMENGEKMEDAW
jgi:hypothetical protein